MIERLAELMHEEWLALKAEQGYHPYGECGCKTGIVMRCSHCRSGLVPWTDLPEEVKEVNRRGVRRFFKELGIPEAAEAGWNQGIERVEKHLGQWGRGLRLTEDEQRDVHLVALGALLMLCPGGDRERMTRIHRACGCIVCRAEAKAKREMGEEVDGG